jgi:hypothetical protein
MIDNENQQEPQNQNTKPLIKNNIRRIESQYMLELGRLKKRWRF